MRATLLRNCCVARRVRMMPFAWGAPPCAQCRAAIQRTVCSASAAAAAPPADAPTRSRAYPFPEIEAKWQRFWEEHETFKTPHEIDTSKPKYYVLDMFPYPRCANAVNIASASALHQDYARTS
jgi:hypothetical protein